jgi:hypothetical protein
VPVILHGEDLDGLLAGEADLACPLAQPFSFRLMKVASSRCYANHRQSRPTAFLNYPYLAHVKLTVTFCFWRAERIGSRAAPKPTSIIAQVAGSGTAETAMVI